jgi:hypothetical protein
MRLMFIKCCGPILSDVMLPPGAPQPSVIAGNKLVEYPIEPCTDEVFTHTRNAGTAWP